ncbi:hypothetical protein OE88DRAFT_1602746, partial [Heliocybe sulcata]
EPTYEDLTSTSCLPYLDAVVKEGLRMYPTSTHNARVPSEDVFPLEIPVRSPSGDLIRELLVSAGQVRAFSIYFWVDGDTFKPERWIEPDGLPPKDKLQMGWSNLLTFNAGPRQCLG